MRVVELSLDGFFGGDVFDFAFPHHPQRYADAEKKFPGMPLLVMDREKRLVWGHDYRRFLTGRGVESAMVLETDVLPAEALLLNFNLSDRVFGLNLAEKLLFVRKISRFLEPVEILRRVELGFAVNDELYQNLDRLLRISLRRSLAAGQLSLKAALRIVNFPVPDQRALLELFSRVRFSESHQLLVTQLLEETAFREKKPLSGLLRVLPLADLLNQEMPQREIMAAIRRQRFPELSRCEDEWRQWEKKRSIPNRLALTHAPLFAKEEVQLLVTVKNRLEADQLLKKLK